MSARRVCLVIIYVLLAALILSGCARDTNGAMRAPELIEPVGVASDIALVTRGDYYTLKHFDAAVYAYVEELYLPVDGVVKEVLAQPGDFVREGEPVITLDLDSARSRAESIAHARKVALYQDEIASLGVDILRVQLEKLIASRADNTQLELKRLEIEQALADIRHRQETRALEWEADEAELARLQRTLLTDAVYAPFDGVLARRIELGEGSRVKAYDTLAYLADDSRLSIKSEYVPESTLRAATGGYYALIGDGRYEIESVEMDTSEYISRILAGESVFSEFTFTGGAEGVEAGMYAALMFVTNYVEDVLLVPTGAVLNDAGGKYVYVAGADGSRKRRDIRVKPGQNERMTQVYEGLEEGESVYVIDK